MHQRPPVGIVVRNVLAVTLVTAVLDALLLFAFGMPESDTTFVLMVSACGMASFVAFFWVDGKLMKGESTLAYLLMVLGVPLLQIVGMVFAARIGIQLRHLVASISLQFILAAVSAVLRSYK